MADENEYDSFDPKQRDQRIREIKRALGQLGSERGIAKLNAPRGCFNGKFCRKNPHFRAYESAKHLPYQIRDQIQSLRAELAGLQREARKHNPPPADQAHTRRLKGIPGIDLDRYTLEVNPDAGEISVWFGKRENEMPAGGITRVIARSKEQGKTVAEIVQRGQGLIVLRPLD
jgi:hypothetical protein